MAELADAEGLNPSDSKGSYGFKSRPGHPLAAGKRALVARAGGAHSCYYLTHDE